MTLCFVVLSLSNEGAQKVFTNITQVFYIGQRFEWNREASGAMAYDWIEQEIVSNSSL